MELTKIVNLKIDQKTDTIAFKTNNKNKKTLLISRVFLISLILATLAIAMAFTSKFSRVTTRWAIVGILVIMRRIV